MRLTMDTIARVKACRGVYSLSDTARHFGISKSTVSDVWSDKRHGAVAPSDEPPNVTTKRVSPDVIRADGPVLLGRGLSPTDAAHELQVARSTFYYHMNGASRYVAA